MNKIYIILILTSIISCSNIENNTTIERNLRGKDYRFPSEIEHLKKMETTNLYYNVAPLYYSWIGDYKKTMELANLNYLHDNELNLNQYKARNSIEYILEQVKQTQIVILNENHTFPECRVYALALLKKLRDSGFTLLCLETISHLDKSLQSRGYCVDSTGFYTVEPQMGNLIRETIKLGYKLLPYDYGDHENTKDREINQAQNIKTILEENPGEKMVIYCGPFHSYENIDLRSDFKTLAQQINENLNINPLTINQSTIIYSVPKTSEFYSKLSAISKPSVFINEKGHNLHLSKQKQYCDIQVNHPLPIEYYGRPNWLNFENEKIWTSIPIKKISISFPIIVLAYLKTESKDAIPVDIVHLKDRKDIKKLCLEIDEYYLRIINQKGQTQRLEISNK